MFGAGLNLAGAILNIILYQVYKNPVNLGCAYVNLGAALMFYFFTVPVLTV